MKIIKQESTEDYNVYILTDGKMICPFAISNKMDSSIDREEWLIKLINEALELWQSQQLN